MGEGVLTIDPWADERWDRFVAAHPQATLYHSSRWLAALRRAYSFRPFHLAYERAGRIEGIFPLLLSESRLTGRRLLSLPFSGPAGPLACSSPSLDALVSAALHLTRTLGCRYLRIQSRDDLPALTASDLAESLPYVSSVLALAADPEQVWQRIPVKQVRRDILRARRAGVQVALSNDRRDLAPFYRLFVQTSRKHGVPPQPREFFEALWDVLHPSGACLLFLATVGGQPAHAQLALLFKDVLIAGYSGTDYRFLRQHPVRLVDWTAIEWACRNGYRSVDFLRSHVANRGLRWYKSSFGAYELPMRSYYYPKQSGLDSLRGALGGRQGKASSLSWLLLGRLPDPALRFLSKRLYRHLA
jgi:CelD/BcsL family acetyltransferase involved in cellulose biosynthesis